MSFLSGLAKVAGGVGGFLMGGPAGAMAGYGIASGLGGGGGGKKGPNPMDKAAQQYGGYASQDRNRFLDILGGGQSALNDSAHAAVENAMPEFQHSLQGLRESAIRRGASNGDLATSYEGDLASATDRNMKNSIAGQAAGLYGTQVGAAGQLAQNSGNTYLDLLSGNRDADQAKANNKTDMWGSILGAAGQIGGAYLGRKP
jgi:hypothetical protein